VPHHLDKINELADLCLLVVMGTSSIRLTHVLYLAVQKLHKPTKFKGMVGNVVKGMKIISRSMLVGDTNRGILLLCSLTLDLKIGISRRSIYPHYECRLTFLLNRGYTM
jgi:hypothetical protein